MMPKLLPLLFLVATFVGCGSTKLDLVRPAENTQTVPSTPTSTTTTTSTNSTTTTSNNTATNGTAGTPAAIPPSSGPPLRFSPTVIDFGTLALGATGSRTVTVTNAGSATVRFSSMGTSDGRINGVAGGTCSSGRIEYGSFLYGPTFANAPEFSLAAGASCTMVLQLRLNGPEQLEESMAIALIGATGGGVSVRGGAQ